MVHLQQYGATVGPLDPPCITANSFVRCRSHRDMCNHGPSCYSHSALKPFIPFPHDRLPSSRLDRHSSTLSPKLCKAATQTKTPPYNPYIPPTLSPNETLPTNPIPDSPTTTTSPKHNNGLQQLQTRILRSTRLQTSSTKRLSTTATATATHPRRQNQETERRQSRLQSGSFEYSCWVAISS